MNQKEKIKQQSVKPSRVPATARVIIDHARLDPSHCLADGLFRPLLRGREAGPLDIRYTYKNRIYSWQGSDLLGINEQSVFLAIHRLAAVGGRTVAVNATDTDSTLFDVRAKLNLAHSAESYACLVLKTTANELTRTMGKSVNGQSASRVINSLAKLSSTTFVISKNGDADTPDYQSQMLSYVEQDGELLIGINPCLAAALCNQKSSKTFVDMREQVVLGSDITKRLHVWLSSWAGASNNHNERRISLAKLISHVWGNEATGDALSSRRKKLHAAIDELNTLRGWKCHINKDEVLSIQRFSVGELVSVKADVTEERP